MPSHERGIGFDDLQYSRELKRVLVPAAGTGKLMLLDPATLELAAIDGFGASGPSKSFQPLGVTSADAGAGFVFAINRSTDTLSVVDPNARSIVAATMLSAQPRFVRYVSATREAWVTEPDAGRIEVFMLSNGARSLERRGAIVVDGGPVGLVIDGALGRAYTHLRARSTIAIDVRTRALVAEWTNGCAVSSGIALDEPRGFLISACQEGTIKVLDVRNRGRVLSSTMHGAGLDMVGYNPDLHHLYIVATSCGCVKMLGMSTQGELSLLGRYYAAQTAHCAVADDRGAWVCDPARGRLLRFSDPYALSE